MMHGDFRVRISRDLAGLPAHMSDRLMRECGSFRLSSDQIIRYGRAFDPFPFHVDARAARKSFLGQLCASGLQSTTWATHLVASSIFPASPCRLRHIASIRYPHPLFADEEVVVRCRLEGRTQDGQLPCSIVAAKLSGETVVELKLTFVPAQADDAAFRAPPVWRAPASAKPLNGSMHYFEDFVPGQMIRSLPHRVEQEEIDCFNDQFSRSGMDSDRGVLSPLGSLSVTQRLAHGVFWSRVAVAAGAGSRDLRWYATPFAGDELTLGLEVTMCRPSRSRQDIGLVESRLSLLRNQDEPVFSYDAVALLHRRRR